MKNIFAILLALIGVTYSYAATGPGGSSLSTNQVSVIAAVEAKKATNDLSTVQALITAGVAGIGGATSGIPKLNGVGSNITATASSETTVPLKIQSTTGSTAPTILVTSTNGLRIWLWDSNGTLIATGKPIILSGTQRHGGIAREISLESGETNLTYFSWMVSSVTNHFSPTNVAYKGWFDNAMQFGLNPPGTSQYINNQMSLYDKMEVLFIQTDNTPQIEWYKEFLDPRTGFNSRPFGVVIGLDNDGMRWDWSGSTFHFWNNDTSLDWMRWSTRPDGGNLSLIYNSAIDFSLVTNANPWYIADGRGLIGRYSNNLAFLDASPGGSEVISFFAGANVGASGITNTILFGGYGGGYAGFRFNGDTLKWEFSSHANIASSWSAINSELSTFEKHYDVGPVFWLGGTAGDFVNLGNLDISGGGASGSAVVQFDYFDQDGESGASRFVYTGNYDDFGDTNWREIMPQINGSRSSDVMLDVRTANTTNRQFRLRRSTSSGDSAAVRVVVKVSNRADSLIWRTVTSTGSGASVVGQYRHSVLTQVVRKVGINTNAPVTALHIGNGGDLTVDGFVSIGATNAAPANVTIGTTAPDQWFVIKNASGTTFYVPGWTAH